MGHRDQSGSEPTDCFVNIHQSCHILIRRSCVPAAKPPHRNADREVPLPHRRAGARISRPSGQPVLIRGVCDAASSRRAIILRRVLPRVHGIWVSLAFVDAITDLIKRFRTVMVCLLPLSGFPARFLSAPIQNDRCFGPRLGRIGKPLTIEARLIRAIGANWPCRSKACKNRQSRQCMNNPTGLRGIVSVRLWRLDDGPAAF